MSADVTADVRVRGIYATALTRTLIDAGHGVVQASAPIRERFDADLPAAPLDADVATTRDRLGVGVHGEADAVAAVAADCRVARDALSWSDPAPLAAVFDAEVVDTAGGGAVLDLGGRDGYLPFDAADGYVEEGDRLRVQVQEPKPPWSDDRPGLGVDLRLPGGLVALERGRSGVTAAADGERATELARTTDLLSASAPDGWGVRWERAAADAGMDAMDTALDRAVERAGPLVDLDADGGRTVDPDGTVPRQVAAPLATRWVWLGRESRFALDRRRRAVAETMPGHHRIKAGDERASAAVDFVEALCDLGGGTADASGDADGADGDGGDADGAFPFDVVTRQFGPGEGDRLALGHGKPDGRLLRLGPGEVTDRGADGSLRLRREITSSGKYDALGTERRPGDVAITKLKEDRWWYPTAYRGEDGASKGTYVNVCTPVEIFPDVARYVDLHVDVVKRPDGTVERVDEDELDAAVAAGDVPEALAEKARRVAEAVESGLS